ncbi:uncharacterized protein [Cicer arietinum]|uniref:Uncharacterized protein LOC101512807 n=1 Tax=Cicer arietinum TaxID=3827 RepID=A0A1S2XS41_CICAR|nr:uncharacterized protein LOC101512807 [Cicer arietinum]
MKLILATLIISSLNLIHGQIISSCTSSMITKSFTPCANIITGSTNNAPSSSLPSSPLPAPSPGFIGSNSPTILSSAPIPLSPQDSKTLGVDETYKYENLKLAQAGAVAPSSTPIEAEAPTKTSRILPVLTPSPSASYPLSPSAFLLIGIVMLFSIH